MSVQVIVPVYGAAQELDACMKTLERTLPHGVGVLLADDASPGEAIATIAHAAHDRGKLNLRYVRRETNLGFVGNVNAALRETAPDDVVLLNSDTRTTAHWWQRMLACAESDPRIATITPWSNNAEICSLPEFCRAAAAPADADAYADAIARAVPTPAYPELPTGVGFCMYLRRAALDIIGDLDLATFGRGYGEENDWCLRAAGHGWRNVLCDDAYVVHTGGASFAATGHAPGGENLRRLNARYPGYNGLIAHYIMNDPLHALRQRIVRQLAASGAATTQPGLFDASP